MNSTYPLVSVILPVYNAEEYLAAALESILNQTYRNFELNIIDDGSTDRSKAIIEKYASSDQRIRFISRENRGLPTTLNELIAMSKGKYYARMDADDYSYPKRLEKQVNYMEMNPDITILGTSVKTTNNCQILFQHHLESNEHRKVRLLFENVGVSHPTAMYRAEAFEKMNIGYREDIVTSEDYFLWVDAEIAGGVIDSIPEVLLDYRVTDNQMSSRYKREITEQDRLIKEYLLKQFGTFSKSEVELLWGWSELEYIGKPKDNYMFFRHLLDENKKAAFCSQRILEQELAYQWMLKAFRRIKNMKNFELFASKYTLWFLKPGTLFYVVRNIWYTMKMAKKNR